MSKEERQEGKFWRCRRALRLWPVQGGSRQDVDDYLVGKLRMQKDHVDSLGEFSVKRILDKRNKCKKEVVVFFDTVTFADSYLRANIEFRNKACTRGRYYSCTVCISCYPYLYMCTGIYACVMFLQWL